MVQLAIWIVSFVVVIGAIVAVLLLAGRLWLWNQDEKAKALSSYQEKQQEVQEKLAIIEQIRQEAWLNRPLTEEEMDVWLWYLDQLKPEELEAVYAEMGKWERAELDWRRDYKHSGQDIDHELHRKRMKLTKDEYSVFCERNTYLMCHLTPKARKAAEKSLDRKLEAQFRTLG